MKIANSWRLHKTRPDYFYDIFNPFAAGSLLNSHHEMMTKSLEMTETMENGYSYYLRVQRELSNEYPHGRVKMIYMFYFFMHWTKVNSAAEGLRPEHNFIM